MSTTQLSWSMISVQLFSVFDDSLLHLQVSLLFSIELVNLKMAKKTTKRTIGLSIVLTIPNNPNQIRGRCTREGEIREGQRESFINFVRFYWVLIPKNSSPMCIVNSGIQRHNGESKEVNWAAPQAHAPFKWVLYFLSKG